MYIYIHTCIYKYIYMYTVVYMYMCMYIYIYIHTYIMLYTQDGSARSIAGRAHGDTGKSAYATI